MKEDLYADFSKEQIDKTKACSNQEELLKLAGLEEGEHAEKRSDASRFDD